MLFISGVHQLWEISIKMMEEEGRPDDPEWSGCVVAAALGRRGSAAQGNGNLWRQTVDFISYSKFLRDKWWHRLVWWHSVWYYVRETTRNCGKSIVVTTTAAAAAQQTSTSGGPPSCSTDCHPAPSHLGLGSRGWAVLGRGRGRRMCRPCCRSGGGDSLWAWFD